MLTLQRGGAGAFLSSLKLQDLIGSLCLCQPAKESRLFPMLVVFRVLFVPLLMLCNVQSRTYLPVFFYHDAAFTAIMVLFSLSSGYFVCLSMSYAPQ